MSASPTRHQRQRGRRQTPYSTGARNAYEQRVCFAPNHIRDSHITEDELRIDFVGDNAESDQAIGVIRKPIVSNRPLLTRNGERRDNADAAAHMQLNACPDQALLRRCARCRLVDPNNDALSFWVLSDTRGMYHTSMVSRLETSGFYCPDEGDIWVWVTESMTTSQRRQPNPPPFQIPTGERTFAIIHKEDIAETAFIAVKARCYTSMCNSEHAASKRRTGFFIMKDLRFA